MAWQDHIPAPVKATLKRSYDDRVARLPECDPVRLMIPVRKAVTARGHEYAYVGGNIDNVFWGKTIRSFDDALNGLHLVDLNMLVIIYDRMVSIATARDASTPTRLWDGIQWIRNMWVARSAGFKCKYFDRSAQSALYESLVPRVCRDFGVGACDHPGCDTWREVPLPGDEKGLHFLIGSESDAALTPDDAARLDEVHLDWTSPVSAAHGDGCCTIRAFNLRSYRLTYRHIRQAIFGIGTPTSPFKFDDYCAEVEALDNAKHKLTEAERGDLADLRASWHDRGSIWACQGQAGWDAALPYLTQIEQYRAKVR